MTASESWASFWCRAASRPTSSARFLISPIVQEPIRQLFLYNANAVTKQPGDWELTYEDSKLASGKISLKPCSQVPKKSAIPSFMRYWYCLPYLHRYSRCRASKGRCLFHWLLRFQRQCSARWFYHWPLRLYWHRFYLNKKNRKIKKVLSSYSLKNFTIHYSFIPSNTQFGWW